MAALPVIALVSAVIGTGVSIYEGVKANQAQQKALKAQRSANDLQAARQRAEAVRAARIAYAQSSQAAENQGVATSSASQGGLASIQTQLGANLSFLDQYNYYQDQASIQFGKEAAYRQTASTFGDVAKLGWNAYANAPQLQSTWNSIFKKPGG